MNYLRFTDDILLIANIPEELQLIIELDGMSKMVELLFINFGKTEMVVNEKPNVNIEIN